MKNIFIIISILAGILYCYGSIVDNNLISNIGLYVIVPSLLVHYLINKSNKLNILYIVAMLICYAADLKINLYGDDISINALSVGGFIIFNLLIAIIIFEKMNVLNFRKIILISIIITGIFMAITYFILEGFDDTVFIITTYFLSLSLLVTLCTLFYNNNKTKESLFFLLGAICYVIASIFAEFMLAKNTSAIVIIGNISAYYLNNYFYTRAMLSSEKA